MIPTSACENLASLPTGVRQALAAAEANGWTTRVTFSDIEVESVAFRARRGAVSVSSRHEAKPGKAMGFVVGWRMPGPLGIPARLGFRELLAELKEPSREAEIQKNPDAVA